MIQNTLYQEDISRIVALELPWEMLSDKRVLITGATGMLGSVITDVLMSLNMNINVVAMSRSESKARDILSENFDKSNFEFLCHDVNRPLDHYGDFDYIIHAASNTHPIQYSTDPIGTMASNIIGTYNLLEYAAKHHTRRFLFLSSVEIYGENRGDTEKFDENYCGYINCNTVRAGYPESKRAGEALCQAYIRQKNMDIVIPRLCRLYGPSMLKSDSKAISQFIKKSVAGEDIVLKSNGTQLYSYSYAADAASAVFTILFKGVCGEAYNIADGNSDIFMRELAQTLADITGTKVAFEIPDDVESAGYSKATKAILDSTKINALGWKPFYKIKNGLERTVTILKEI